MNLSNIAILKIKSANYRYIIRRIYWLLYNDHKFKRVHIMLPKTSTDVKSYDEQTNWMYFLNEIEDLLEKYNTIWDKVSADMKKNLIASLSIIKIF